MKSYYLGVDAGFSGAVAVVSSENGVNNVERVIDMPVRKMDKGQRVDLAMLKDTITRYKISKATLEKAQAMPKQGIVSTGKYMQSYGEVYGLLVGLGIPISEIHPTTWKKAMMKDMPKGKEGSIIRVQQIFPNMRFNRKKDHGIADAVLICLYGLMTMP